ncbi:hypothetical protein BT96DRAFT_1026453 [Gymnopus androsaceus JB14]|uniref:Uncharacterized protein n=1 Tax=Gymnopus androsaceus JB14 TaxID=1447944 RepID=A0A6A4GJW4_9AGAR|nr:hypothetical protein BT96DRAFT_1026453 [Gymnopus androsaceus JB14]
MLEATAAIPSRRPLSLPLGLPTISTTSDSYSSWRVAALARVLMALLSLLRELLTRVAYSCHFFNPHHDSRQQQCMHNTSYFSAPRSPNHLPPAPTPTAPAADPTMTTTMRIPGYRKPA